MIEVKETQEDTFKVTVKDGGGQTEHTVTVDDDYYRKLTGGKITKKDLVERSFQFLLKRESKESILPSFNLKVISRYFPEYEDEIQA